MARIDLNIVDRGIQGSTWIAEDVGLTAEHLDKVLEQKTDNSGALNSLPTPFARFFVAREAFRRAQEEHVNKENEAGFAYRQLVSDILDVYELLFNRKYHENTWAGKEKKIELREWKSKENLKYIKEKMPVLFNSIDNYYKTDIKEDNLYFLVYTESGHDKLLACTSPMTGFITPPDMDKTVIKKDGTSTIIFAGEQYEDLHIRRKSGGEYFRDIKMFEERDEDFKNYMYNELFGNDVVASEFKAIKEYIRSFKNDNEIRNDYKLKLVDLKTDQNDSLVVNGLPMRSSDEIDINSYFTKTMIRLPYRIARKKFTTVKYSNDSKDRDYDFLLPFKPEIIADLFPDMNIDADVHINRQSYTVSLRYNGKEYQKEYAIDPWQQGMGKVIDMEHDSLNFNIGLFPNILSHNESENNYFKVLVVAADEDPEAPRFSIDEIKLAFFKDKQQIQESQDANYGVLPAVVRSTQQTEKAESGTKFYELFNTSFDFMEVTVLGDTGLLIPVWEKSEPTNDTFTYAIDLGTSNTFMSRCKNGEDNKPELFKMERPMVSYMHEMPQNNQVSLAKCIENSIFDMARNKIKSEFVPAVIDGSEYKFPIRTALCGIKKKISKPKLFDNHNIAFFYEKMMSNDDQDIHTDIKWEQNDDMLRVFVRELLLIVKCDILQRNGDLDRTNLVWFRPLSFMGSLKETYQDIWKEEPKNILGVQSEQINCYSESEAPYYYFKKKDYIADSDAVTVIDIGGGSTDFVYFKDNKPLMANSVHFGCDVLWENGFIEFDNERQNGIYLKYADTIRFDREDLNDLNVCFKDIDDTKTKDIINFWLSNASHCDITKWLRADFKPVFVYHLTSILFYMAYMYRDNKLPAPRSVLFSGNGSRYIDSFISQDKNVLKKIIDLVFSKVFEGEHNVNLKLPEERKEATCYGGLYRGNQPDVPEKVYQGDVSAKFETVGDINKNFDILENALMDKYKQFNALYKEVLDLLKREHVIENTANTTTYINTAEQDMATPLNTYYKSQIKEKYQDEVILYDSVFFLPIIRRIFEMTKLNNE
ncbi:MAG: hypothetical protein MJZ42_02830 [Bacteroidales bacterium]|nr:hypothetical protein [Bacteroidales bacterium]